MESEVIPSKVNLENPEPLYVEARMKNVGTSVETVTADVVKTEGLTIRKPARTTFTLKPGESRTVTFEANLTSDAVSGDYIIDVQAKTENGVIVWDRARLRVAEESGFSLFR